MLSLSAIAVALRTPRTNCAGPECYAVPAAVFVGNTARTSESFLNHFTYDTPPFDSNLFSGTEVFDVIDVNVAEQNETFHMVGMGFDQLTEERFGFQRSIFIGKQQGQIE